MYLCCSKDVTISYISTDMQLKTCGEMVITEVLYVTPLSFNRFPKL